MRVHFKCKQWDDFFGDSYGEEEYDLSAIPRVGDVIDFADILVVFPHRIVEVEGEHVRLEEVYYAFGSYRVTEVRWFIMDDTCNDRPLLTLEPIDGRILPCPHPK